MVVERVKLLYRALESLRFVDPFYQTTSTVYLHRVKMALWRAREFLDQATQSMADFDEGTTKVAGAELDAADYDLLGFTREIFDVRANRFITSVTDEIFQAGSGGERLSGCR